MMIIKYGINNFTCITSRDYYLQGDRFYVPEMQYLSLKLRMCQNTTTKKTCKPQSQINSFFQGRTMSFAFINNLFDSTNFETPVK